MILNNLELLVLKKEGNIFSNSCRKLRENNWLHLNKQRNNLQLVKKIKKENNKYKKEYNSFKVIYNGYNKK